MQSSDTFVSSLSHTSPQPLDCLNDHGCELDDLNLAADVINQARESFEDLFARRHMLANCEGSLQ